MALIEVGTTARGSKIVSIDEVTRRARTAVGSVVNGVAVWVSDAQHERGNGAPGRELKRVIAGVGGIRESVDGAEANERSERVGITAAGYRQVVGRLSCHRHAARGRKRGAIVGTDGFADAFGITR